MRYCLFLNGEIPSKRILPNFAQYKAILCTDGAFDYLGKLKNDVDYIIGDFDSLENDPIYGDKRFIHLKDQSYTDFEKCIHFLLKNLKDEDIFLDVFGANGKESDHFLGNLSIAKKYINKIRIEFFDSFQSYFLTTEPIRLNCKIDEHISIFPFPLAKNVSLKGLKYLVQNKTFEIGHFMGIRNQAIQRKVEIEFLNGCLLIFRGNNG